MKRPDLRLKRRFLLLSALAAGLALVFPPGGTRELLRVTPSGIEDSAGWTRLDPQFRADRSDNGTDVKVDDATFRFDGESYIVPLDPGARFPEVFSVSLWARPSGDPLPLLALETTAGKIPLFLGAKEGRPRTAFAFATEDPFQRGHLLLSREGRTFATERWIHLVYVVDRVRGQHVMYVNGRRENGESLMAGPCRSEPLRRLWIGSAPDSPQQHRGEIRDVRVVQGALTWWQIQMYRFSGRYFYSLFHIPPGLIWGGLWAVSLGGFVLGAWRRTAPVGTIPPPSPAPRAKAARASWLPDVLRSLFLLAALAGFFFILFAFYPGAMSEDSITQYQQGRDWRFADWHPPFMAAVLGIFDRVFHSPAPLLFFHDAWYWLGFFLLARSLLQVNVPVACVFAVLGFWPAFMTWTGVLWKDVGTAATFLVAAALLTRATIDGRPPRRWIIAAIVAALVYGTLVRSYSFLAYLPLMFWLADLICRGRTLRRPRVAVLGLFLGLAALFPVANALTNAILKPTREHTIQAVFYHDLLGISVNSGEKCLVHAYHRPDFDCAELQHLYTPVCIDTAMFDPRNPLIRVTDTGPLFRDWLRAVRTHPRAYLTHRWNVFAILFSFGNRPNWHYYREIKSNPFGFKLASTSAGTLFDSYIRDAFWWPFFGYLYLLVSLYEAVYVAVVLAVRRSVAALSAVDLSILFLCMSALLYFLPYFFLCPSRDFRYLYWGTIASTLAFILMLYALLGNGSKSQPETKLEKTKPAKPGKPARMTMAKTH